MKRTLVSLFIAAGLAVFISGCATGPIPLPDTVTIADVQSTKNPDSEFTSYKVKVLYALRNADHGVVMLGFDLEEPRRYIMLGEQKVERAVGEVEVHAEVRLPQRSTVTVYVNLSEDPHPTQWTPLAKDTRLLTLSE